MFAASRVRVLTVVRVVLTGVVLAGAALLLMTVLNAVVFAQPQAPLTGSAQ